MTLDLKVSEIEIQFQRSLIVFILVWKSSCDGEVYEIAKDAGKLAKFKKAFMRHFASKNLEKAKEFSINCNLIMQVFFKYERFMSSNQKERFGQHLEGYISAVAEEREIVALDKEKSFARFLEIRLKSSGFKLFELLSEVSCRMDLSEYIDDPLFEYVIPTRY